MPFVLLYRRSLLIDTTNHAIEKQMRHGADNIFHRQDIAAINFALNKTLNHLDKTSLKDKDLRRILCAVLEGILLGETDPDTLAKMALDEFDTETHATFHPHDRSKFKA